MHRASRRAAIALAAGVIACGRDRTEARAPKTTASTAVVPASSSTAPAAAQPSANTGTVSALPATSYATLPGWLVIRAASPAAGTAGDSAATVVIFPGDSAWSRVAAGTPLLLLAETGHDTLRMAGGAEIDDFWDATHLRVAGAKRSAAGDERVAWLVAADESAGLVRVALRDSVAPDGRSHSWIAGHARLSARLTGAENAEFWAEQLGSEPLLVSRVGIDREADAHMGAESDSVLQLGSWRLPRALAAFRFEGQGRTLMIFQQDGYECANYHAVIFEAARIVSAGDRHYFECAR